MTQNMQINLCSKDASLIRMVEHLQAFWGTPFGDITSDAVTDTYHQLLEESDEYKDVLDALLLGDKEKAQVLLRDVSADMIFFILQLVVNTKLSEKFRDDFYSIYVNNMQKVCLTEELALATVKHYEIKGEPCYSQYVERYDHWVVRRKSDNKIKKPLGFKEVILDK